jgi:hypothetical protein
MFYRQRGQMRVRDEIAMHAEPQNEARWAFGRAR